ncbi:MAG TPA: nucleoside transporter C-terminal domain-containing protein [Rhizomicrobium sp.]|nr:nucleoside transporter C-terminal domain-containing protein [Rhizomicrobium sp.]
MGELHLQSLLGIGAILLLAWLLSENRRAFPLRTVVAGLAMQIGLALLLLKVPVARDGLFALNGIVTAITDATKAGTSFIFGYLGGGEPPFKVTNPAGMVNFAFGVLPLIIVISALAALLWHWRILSVIVKGLAFVLKRFLGVGGAIGVGGAATVFVGNVEGLLVIRPYLAKLNRAELFIVFTIGLSVVAGTVFVLYATILNPVLPGALGHILIASVMSLFGAIVVARIMIPGDAATDSVAGDEMKYRSSMDAISHGTEVGLKMYWQIIAMLLVVIALVALANMILAHLPAVWGAPITLQRVFGWLFAPVVWLYGVPWNEAVTAGSLLGTKTILNELIAYLNLAALPAGTLDPRSTLIMVYAMCGFANLSSVGIVIAGMSALEPGRRDEVVPLVMRALLSGTMASGLTGSIIGLLPVS